MKIKRRAAASSRAAWVVAFGCLSVWPGPAFAIDASRSRCIAVSEAREAVASHKGTWTELTTEEWQFLRGVYVMNSGTPSRLPYGNGAALAQVDGFAEGVVFFIDGDQACTPMRVSAELLLLMHAAAGGGAQFSRGR
jgi:hypothetical protein